MTESFDAVVVGGDVAAGVVALSLLGAKSQVAVIAPEPSEAGPVALVWPMEFNVLRPELAKGLPGRAPLVEHRWQLLDGAGMTSVEYRTPPGGDGSEGPSALLEGVAGRWLLERAEGAGAVVRHGSGPITTQNGRVTGARAGEESLSAPLTIISDPSVLRPERIPPPNGLSRTLELGGGPVANRFGIRRGQALSVEAVLAFAEPATRAVGTLVAAGEHVEAGVFAVTDRASPPGAALQPLLEKFMAHPNVAPFLKGATARSSSRARWLPGASRTPGGSPGVLRIGRAAGLDSASGPLSTGPGYSVRSALLAAEAVQSCWRSGDRTAQGAPARFERLLASGGVRRALLSQRRRSESVAFRGSLRSAYPPVVRSLLHRLMTETGGRKESVVAAVKGVRKAQSLRTGRLALDAVELGGVL